ncbi:MAG: hypothetical protein IT381_28165 [Deltaproteobacteria bacterium]|nr:hypothetical protein [Deltaproteobacteria bacterium]
MSASHWAIGIVCLLAGGLVGFFIGRVSAGIAPAEVAAEKLRAIDEKAAADKAVVDETLRAREKLAEEAGIKELTDALEDDFALPPDHPLRKPSK